MQFKTFWNRVHKIQTDEDRAAIAGTEPSSFPNFVEDEVNDWLKQNPGIRVLQMTQSCTNQDGTYMAICENYAGFTLGLD